MVVLAALLSMCAADGAGFPELPGSLVQAEKTAAMVAAGSFALPGEEVRYRIAVGNLGAVLVGTEGMLLVDEVPTGVSFKTGDDGPEASVLVVPGLSGLIFDAASDLGFSDAATRPETLADCAYAPEPGIDPAVRFVCIQPRGTLVPCTLIEGFSVSYVVVID